MKDFWFYVIVVLNLVLVYFYIIFPVHNYLCEREGMRASHFVRGCVIKE